MNFDNDNKKEDDEEALAVNDMIKKIAGTDSDVFEDDEIAKSANKKNSDSWDDEDEWDVSTSIDLPFKKILNKFKSKKQKIVSENKQASNAENTRVPSLKVQELKVQEVKVQETKAPDSKVEPQKPESELKNIKHENIERENIDSENGGSEDIKSEDIKSEDIKSEDIKSEDIKPEDIKSEDTEPLNSEPGNAEVKSTEPESESEPEQEETKEPALTPEQETMLAVEDMMYAGESREDTENRHKNYLEDAEDFLPVINTVNLGVYDSGTEDIIDELNLNLAEQVTTELSAHKRKIVRNILLSVAGCFVFFVLFVLFTRPGHVIATRVIAKVIISKTEKQDKDTPGRLDEQEVINRGDEGDFVPVYTGTPAPTDIVSVTGTVTATPTPYVDYHPHFEEDDSVINVLLIGVENYENYTYGRSDSMIVASLDKDGGPVKLVSLMRDMYVEIPGYSDNRLNASYAFGGPELLLETIELNFGLKCDGYVTVDYAGFESIVDYIGGIEISLTQEEADYLNTTNYISVKANRCVTAGKQMLNGNQVMGYCRVRYVPTANGLYMDFGRTYRQRVVLQKIFEEYKSSGFTVLYGAMNECLKYVTCSDNLEPVIADCLNIFIDKGISEMETFRIPASGHYEEIKINGAQVLSIDSENANILHEYLYGEN